MNANLSALLYLVAGVLFILSLRGLSSPASSRRGNFLGMAGMAIAVATTLARRPPGKVEPRRTLFPDAPIRKSRTPRCAK